ncbi:MAG: SurA N-terminal domain-containing protein [Desulfatirhabdiaceae bacterium]
MIWRMIVPFKKGLSVFLVVFGLLGVLNVRVLAEVVDRIVAIVNNDVISLIELNEALKPYMEKVMAANYGPEKEKQMIFKIREEVLNQLIDQKLTDQEIARYKLNVNEKEIDQSIERIKQVNSITDEQFRAALAREGLSMETYRQKMREQLLRANLLNREVKSKIVITREEIKTYYDSNPDLYGVEQQYYLKSFFLKPPPSSTEQTHSVNQDAMNELLIQLRAGQNPDDLVKSFQARGIGVQYLDLGLFKLDSLSPDIQTALRGMAVHEYSNVIETDQGLQIFYLQDIVKTAGKTLEQATPEIESKLYKEIVDDKFSKWLDELRKRSHIQIIQ